jgi:hypothetical protein
VQRSQIEARSRQSPKKVQERPVHAKVEERLMRDL